MVKIMSGSSTLEDLVKYQIGKNVDQSNSRGEYLRFTYGMSNTTDSAPANQAQALQIISEMTPMKVQTQQQQQHTSSLGQSYSGGLGKQSVMNTPQKEGSQQIRHPSQLLGNAKNMVSSQTPYLSKTLNDRIQHQNSEQQTMSSSNLLIAQQSSDFELDKVQGSSRKREIVQAQAQNAYLVPIDGETLFHRNQPLTDQQTLQNYQQQLDQRKQKSRKQHYKQKDKRQENQVMEVYTARVINSGDNGDSTKHNNLKTSKKNHQQKGSETAYKETLPMMISAPASTQRRSSHKNINKKSAGSQNRHSKDGKGRSNYHNSGQPSASQVRTFNLIVSQNGEASLTPIRKHYAQAHDSINMKAATSTSVHNSSVLQNKQQKGGSSTAVDPNQQRRMQSTAPRLFSYKPKINDMKGSPFLQPIISQKSIIQPGNSLGPSSAGANQQVMSQHGKQVIASMIKHQQQPPIVTNQLKQQSAQQMRQSQLANYNGGGQVLAAIPAPLPKFLTKKNQRLNMMNQQQTAQLQQNLQQNNLQQQQRKNTSVLDAFIAQQQYIYMHNNQQQYHTGSGEQDLNGNMILAENARPGHLGQNNINGRNSVQPVQNTQHSNTNLSNNNKLSNGQIQGQANTGAGGLQGPNSQNTPVVNYLMQINQSQNQAQTQKRQNQNILVAQSQQPILQRSSSNVMTQFQNQNSIQVQGQQYVQRDGSKNNLIVVDAQGAPNKVKTLQPQFMILGQSPSNQRLHSHNNSLGQHHHWNQTGEGQVGDLRLNGVGKQVLSDSNANPRAQSLAAGAATFHHNLSKQFAQTNAASQYQTGGVMPQYYESQDYYQHQMHLSDDDGGIDERFDGDDDSANNNDSDDIQDDLAHTSPKAPKPKPLDQTFQPQKGKKYFSVTIGYPAMRRALRARGWVEVKCYKKLYNIAGYTSSPCKLANVGLESTMNRNFDQNIDLKFVLSAQDANHQNLKNNCLINQNRGEGNLTCKSGLKESLSRSYQHMACWYPMEHCDPAGLGPDAFFPRSHVINSAESLQEFQRDFCLTEAENYLRKFIRKFKGFKDGLKQKQQAATVRTSTPGPNKRTPSKNRQSMNKMKSKTQLSSNEDSPVKGAQEEDNYTDQTTIQQPSSQQQPSQQDSNCTLQDLGFLKEKLVICCNIMRKRLKPVEDKLDTKKGIRTDRMTAGVILIEERSFLLRSPKNLSAAYMKYIQKEDWYIKALSRFPSFKKDKSLAPPLQQTAMCEKIAKTCSDFIERLRPLYPQTDLNGYNNLWIVKPGGLSRGRKIRLFKDFQKILEYSEVDAAQQLHAANGLASSNNTTGANTQYYMSHQKPGGEDVNAYTKKTWVIQKYIENPMLIMNRKFDIRVWVVISSWNPLRIYIYKQCYMRFSCNDYDPRCPQNLFSHLTNNSVTKKMIERPDNARILNKIPGNMWNLTQFKEFLGGKPIKSNMRKSTSHEVDDVTSQHQKSQRPRTASDIPEKEKQNDESTNMPLDSTITPIPNTGVSLAEGGEEEQQPEANYEEIGEEVWETKWYPQMKEIIIQSILSAWDKIEWRKGGVGLYGFDLFPDADGKLWLLEINKCPTMEYSTQVTKVLVPRFLEDLVELIIDCRKGNHPEVAGFEKIYDVGKLRDLTDFQQTQKDIKIDGKGIDAYNNQNYLSALHRNKRKAERNGGKVSHQHY